MADGLGAGVGIGVIPGGFGVGSGVGAGVGLSATSANVLPIRSSATVTPTAATTKRCALSKSETGSAANVTLVALNCASVRGSLSENAFTLTTAGFWF
jgi:hypothetical protein